MPSFERICIYISLLLLIVVLIILKNRLQVSSRVGELTVSDIIEEKFTDSSFLADITAGTSVSIRINEVDILAQIPNEKKKDNAIYLAIIKVNGAVRIINSYDTGSKPDSTKLLFNDLELYLGKSKLLDDKYVFILSRNSAANYVGEDVKNFLRTRLKATKINDVKNTRPYLFIYDLLDNNVRTEQLGAEGTSEKFTDVLFATVRTLSYNNEGLLMTGLQCYLDATRKESYTPEFGNRWKDISGNNRHFDWSKQPIFGDGQMLNTLSYGEARGPNADTFNLGNGSEGYAIVLYSKTNTLRNSHSFLFEGVPNTYGIQSHLTWGDSVLYFDQGWPYVGDNRNRVRIYQTDWTEYHVWVFVRAYDGSLKVYKDGNLLVSGERFGATPLNLKSSPVRLNIGWDANISKFMVYNIHLMPDDVRRLSNWIMNDEKKQRENRMKLQMLKTPSNIPVRLGLQCYLDSRQYKQGELVWKDLSGNNYDFKWNTAPLVEYGSIVFNKGEYATSEKGSRMLNIDGRDNYTICWTGKTNQLSTNSLFIISGFHSYNRGIFVHPTWVNNVLYFDQAGCCDLSTQRVYGDVSKFSIDYAFYCIRKTNNERSIYINGVKLYTATTSGSPLNINNDPMLIGKDSYFNSIWYGNLKNFLVYNRDLSDKEIKALYGKMFSPYEFTFNNYDASEQFCRKRGFRLCKASDYCPNNVNPRYPLDSSTWAPISDYPNGWIQVGPGGEMCKTHKQKCQVNKDSNCDTNGDPVWANKQEKEIGVLCCDIKYQPLLINAIQTSYVGDITRMTFFRDKYYQIIDYKNNKAIDVSNIKSIHDYKGLTKNFASGNIDAISITRNNNESLWFKGNHVMLYNYNKQSGNEQLVSEYFNILPRYFKGGFFDAVATRGPNTEYIIFKKNRFCIVDMTTKSTIKYGLISKHYNVFPKDFQLGYFDCAVYSIRSGNNSGQSNCSYLFKNDKYIEYNFANNTIVQGPSDISNEFKYLLPPFSAKNRVCKVLENLSTLNNEWLDLYYKECKGIIKKEYNANLETYKGLVNQYTNDYNKTKEEKRKIKEKIDAFAKALEKKRDELIAMENKLLDIRTKPCKRDEICLDKKIKREICTEEIPKVIEPGKINKKRIIVKEKDVKNIKPKFYELDSRNIEKCYYDPDVGKQFEGGFNFKKHKDAPNFVKYTEIKTINDFDIKDHPDYGNYILKNKIPKQRTAIDFDIKEHPDYIKYESKKK